MVEVIRSFGRKHGLPRPCEGFVLLVEGKFLPNPWTVRSLRSLTGKDPEVVEYLRGSKHYWALVQEASALAVKLKGVLWFGCFGGLHRSVALAEEVGGALKIPVEHRDLGQ